MITASEFAALLAAPEGARLECKEARNRYDFDELVRYCVALANEGGGTILLGVSDERPRRVVGCAAFPEPGRTEAGLFERLGHRVSVEEYSDSGRRVLVVRVPARAAGAPWSDRGTYWMRVGDALVPMSGDRLRAIFAEGNSDYSAEICDGAALSDLDAQAIAEFRRRWARRDGNARISAWSDEYTLRAAELMGDSGVTYAALLLAGTHDALGRLLPQAEVIFEYRSTEAAGPAQDRAEFREGFLSYRDRLWERIDRRNDRQSVQEGFFRSEIPTFDEKVIREGVLNAVCHRDYRSQAPVFVRQYSRRLEIISPGGFPPGVTPQNILDQQIPRNRRLAEALNKCGLIERSGQGVNMMFEQSVRQSKPLPDYAGSTIHQVRLTLGGVVTSPAFVGLLERVGQERLASFTTADFLVLNHLRCGEDVPAELRGRIPELVELGLVEMIGRGRGARYLLSHRFFGALGRTGAYTRRRGLDRQTNKELLVQHLMKAGAAGAGHPELQEVLPALSRFQVLRLLRELQQEGRVVLQGTRRWARWYIATGNGPVG